MVSTANRKPATPRQMEKRLAYLLQATPLDLPPCGCHMLRHTCASLLFAKKLQVEIIASILGHSPEVCRKTYIHFCQANAPRPSTRLLNSISKNKFGERKWKMLTLPEKGGIVTLLNPGSETVEVSNFEN